MSVQDKWVRAGIMKGHDKWGLSANRISAKAVPWERAFCRQRAKDPATQESVRKMVWPVRVWESCLCGWAFRRHEWKKMLRAGFEGS